MKSWKLLPVSLQRLFGGAIVFKGERRGMAAVEFGMLLPLMLVMFFGTVELTTGFAANRKLTYLARDLADLASQSTTLINSGGSSADVTTIFSAVSSVFYPFTGAKMTITGIVFKTGADSKVHAYTDWSVASNSGTLRACGELQRTSVAGNAPPAVPDAFFTAGTTIIAADVAYSYQPLIGSVFLGIGSNGTQLGSSSISSISMSQTSYMQPRAVTRVTYSGSTGQCSGVTFP